MSNRLPYTARHPDRDGVQDDGFFVGWPLHPSRHGGGQHGITIDVPVLGVQPACSITPEAWMPPSLLQSQENSTTSDIFFAAHAQASRPATRPRPEGRAKVPLGLQWSRPSGRPHWSPFVCPNAQFEQLSSHPEVGSKDLGNSSTHWALIRWFVTGTRGGSEALRVQGTTGSAGSVLGAHF